MTSLYGLRQLITNKYGEDKFGVGCLIVAMFVGHKSEHKWTRQMVEDICNSKKYDSEITVADAERFKQLFGLHSIDQLYELETTPVEQTKPQA
jgi:hypothetical protein